MKKLLTIAALMAASVTVQADVLDSTDVCVIQEAVETAYTVNEQRPSGSPVWSRPDWQAYTQARRDFADHYETTSYTDRFIIAASERVAELSNPEANVLPRLFHDMDSRLVTMGGVDFPVNTGATVSELRAKIDHNNNWIASNPCILGSHHARQVVNDTNNELNVAVQNRQTIGGQVIAIATANPHVPQVMIEAMNFYNRHPDARAVDF